MSNDTEALAPQSPDATVIPTDAQPDGAEQKTGNEADPSPAAASKTSETVEPETSRINERFAELTKLRRDAERREARAQEDADRWRRLYEGNQKPAAAEPALPTEQAKTLADFGFDEAKHQSYLMQQAAKAATEAAKRELQAEQQAREKQSRTAAYLGRVKEFAKDKPDFREVTEYAPISDEIAEQLIVAEQGPELAYYLGKNPEIAQQLSALPGNASAFELGMLAARLKFEREAASKARQIVSQAPPPAPALSGASAQTLPKNEEEMSDAEWKAEREKRNKRKKA